MSPAHETQPEHPTPQRPERRALATFLFVWTGQVVSALGSNLTGFALGVWIYQETGSVTRFALITLVTTVPGMLLAPLAGRSSTAGTAAGRCS